MCLAVPAKVIDLSPGNPLTRTGKVDFGGVIKEINLAFTPEAEIGNYVLVHVGFAISVLDEAEANKVLDELAALDELEEAKSTLAGGPVP
ncbi:MAG: HypC/HybG/HupF family hydrogenase formation chaperone [Geminicoccaceae bacterium]